MNECINECPDNYPPDSSNNCISECGNKFKFNSDCYVNCPEGTISDFSYTLTFEAFEHSF